MIMRRPDPRRKPVFRLGTAELRIIVDGAYLRKSTGSTASRIRNCGTSCSMGLGAPQGRAERSELGCLGDR
jgi:hypothetical protein